MVCGHCGEETVGYASVTDHAGNAVVVCHPGPGVRPDCYRRVVSYREPLGCLRGENQLPRGIEDIRDPALILAKAIAEWNGYAGIQCEDFLPLLEE